MDAVQTSDDILISNNIIDSNGFAIYINSFPSDPSRNIIITNNRFKSVWEKVKGDMNAISKINDNIGFITENSGVAVIEAGSTSVDVNHGLNLTPTDGDIVIVPINSMGNATKFYIGAYNSNKFTITVNQIPGPETAIFAWKAKIEK